MNFYVIGTNHKLAPVEIREKLTLPKDQVAGLRVELAASVPGMTDMIAVSTCNRLELYITCRFQITDAKEILRAVLSYLDSGGSEEWFPYFYFFGAEKAIRHLFSVTAALDSMVIGEPQISGQIKEGFMLADKANTVSGFTRRIFETSFKTAKNIRQNTEIGKTPVSISYVAVQLAQKIFDSLADKTVLVIGSGEMAEQSVVNFKQKGVTKIYIINRTFENAVALASKYDASVIRYELLHCFIGSADMIITSTGSKKPILSKKAMAQALKSQKKDAVFIVDIAIPRDVEPEVNTLDNVFLYNIDDLKEIAGENMEGRLRESEKAWQIIEQEMTDYAFRLRFQKAAPLVSALKKKFREMADDTIVKPVEARSDFTPEQKKAVALYAHRLVGKMLHAHAENIRGMIARDEDPGYLLGDIFNIVPDTDETNTQKDKRILYLPLSQKKHTP